MRYRCGLNVPRGAVSAPVCAAGNEPVGGVYLQNPFLGESGTLTVFNTSDIIVGVAVVPEPQTYAMMLAGLALVAGAERRGSRKV